MTLTLTWASATYLYMLIALITFAILLSPAIWSRLEKKAKEVNKEFYSDQVLAACIVLGLIWPVLLCVVMIEVVRGLFRK